MEIESKKTIAEVEVLTMEERMTALPKDIIRKEYDLLDMGDELESLILQLSLLKRDITEAVNIEKVKVEKEGVVTEKEAFTSDVKRKAEVDKRISEQGKELSEKIKEVTRKKQICVIELDFMKRCFRAGEALARME